MPAATDLALDRLYLEAAAVTASNSKSFFFATRFFPRELARSAHAVYWFCRYTDDIVDECASQEQGRVELEAWALKVKAAFRGERVQHPVLAPFLDAMRRHAIPEEYALELIEGMRMDLENTRYRDFAQLRVFCYRVASVVGLMMSHVIGFEGPALSYAIDLGIAMQLTNILRDIGEDLDRQRIYIPSEDLERFGYSEAALRQRVCNEAFRNLMRFEVARARSFYEASSPGIPMLSRDGRFAVQVASDVYRAILGRIEHSDYDVFTRRAYVPAAQKYWITARSMALPVARRGLQKIGLQGDAR